MPLPTSPLFNIPDFVRWDRKVMLPLAHCRHDRGGVPLQDSTWVSYLLAVAAVQQRRTLLILPDVMVAQLRWGPDQKKWPSSWRQILQQALLPTDRSERNVLARVLPASIRQPQGIGECFREHCPLAQVRSCQHKHFMIDIDNEADLAMMAFFKDKLISIKLPARRSNKKQFNQSFIDCYNLNFKRRPRSSRALEMERQQLVENSAVKGLAVDQTSIDNNRAERRIVHGKKTGRLFKFYVPAEILGHAAGLSVSQAHLLTILAGEVTRGSTSRPDRAVLVSHGVARPWLPADKEYVLFAGNLKNSKRNEPALSLYWLANRAGYLPADEDIAHKRGVKRHCYLRIINDLQWLQQEMQAVIQFILHDGRYFLLGDQEYQYWSTGPYRQFPGEKTAVRIYLPATYLVDWRNWLLTHAGFTIIPGESLLPASTQFESGKTVRAWLHTRKYTLQQAASVLGIRATTVTRLRNGEIPLTQEQQEAIQRDSQKVV